jgi:hypothetical protein
MVTARTQEPFTFVLGNFISLPELQPSPRVRKLFQLTGIKCLSLSGRGVRREKKLRIRKS